MTETRIKELLCNYISIQQEIEILKNYESCFDNESVVSKYKIKEFHIALLSSAMKTLSDKERFVIEIHLIEHKTWIETTELYELKYGILNGRSERTLKRIQSKAIVKLSNFINKLPVKFLDLE